MRKPVLFKLFFVFIFFIAFLFLFGQAKSVFADSVSLSFVRCQSGEDVIRIDYSVSAGGLNGLPASVDYDGVTNYYHIAPITQSGSAETTDTGYVSDNVGYAYLYENADIIHPVSSASITLQCYGSPPASDEPSTQPSSSSAPVFLMTVSPSTKTVQQGQTATYTPGVRVLPFNGWSWDVNVSCSITDESGTISLSGCDGTASGGTGQWQFDARTDWTTPKTPPPRVKGSGYLITITATGTDPGSLKMTRKIYLVVDPATGPSPSPTATPPPRPTPSPTPSASPTPPTNPGNLQASVSCVSGSSQVSFTWTASTGADGYYLDVTTGQWASDGSGPPWAYKQRTPGTANSFTWNLASPLTNGPPTTPADNTQYWWRLVAYNAAGYSPQHVYPQNNLSPPGANNPVVTLNCASVLPDLIVQSITFANDPYNTYQSGDTVIVTSIMVANIGSGDVTNVNVRFFQDLTAVPNCSTPVTASTILASVPAGTTALWAPVTSFPAPSAGPHYAYALVGCGTTQSDATNDYLEKDYAVSVYAWFETKDGDVGSGGLVDVSQAPLANHYQSTYLAAASSTLGTNVKTQPQPNPPGWRITNYSGHRLIAGSTYNYLAERFKEEAITNPDSGEECTLGSTHDGLNYCSGSSGPVTIAGGTAPSGNRVWFIDQDLIITDRFTVGVADTIVFVVSGNITINTTVNQADGIYISNATFSDVGASGGNIGPQLVINGAVYTQALSLPRVLATGNNTTPADQIIFQPKYLVALANSTLLGSPAVSWREVAP